MWSIFYIQLYVYNLMWSCFYSCYLWNQNVSLNSSWIDHGISGRPGSRLGKHSLKGLWLTFFKQVVKSLILPSRSLCFYINTEHFSPEDGGSMLLRKFGIYKSTLCYNLEDQHRHFHCRDNVNPHLVPVYYWQKRNSQETLIVWKTNS